MNFGNLEESSTQNAPTEPAKRSAPKKGRSEEAAPAANSAASTAANAQ
jgi:hypothetical protein